MTRLCHMLMLALLAIVVIAAPFAPWLQSAAAGIGCCPPVGVASCCCCGDEGDSAQRCPCCAPATPAQQERPAVPPQRAAMVDLAPALEPGVVTLMPLPPVARVFAAAVAAINPVEQSQRRSLLCIWRT